MNTLQAFGSQKKPQKKVLVENQFESLKDTGTAVVESVAKQSTEAVKDMWNALLGDDKYAAKPKLSGELKPKQEVNLQDEAKAKEKKSKAEAPMSYFREIAEAGKTGMHRESQEVRQQIQGILYELQRVAHASKAIERQVTQAVGTGVASPGKYHETFFEWMLTVVRDARKRVENAGAWLQSVKKKKGYNSKNMSQFLSGERSVSSQTS